MLSAQSLQFRLAQLSDIPFLISIETAAFAGDRLSSRRFKHWIKADNAILLVAEYKHKVLAYGLVLLRKGQRLARLYSLAVAAELKGQGVGRLLLQQLEERVATKGWQFMRLEVAENNLAAIALYQAMGYTQFGTYPYYYEDQQHALRMEKALLP